MKEITWNKKQYSFPETWDEMTKDQFLCVTQHLGTLLFEKEVSEEDLYAQRIIALKKIMNIPLWRFKKLYSHEIVDLLKLLDFTKKIDLNDQLIPTIDLRCGLFKKLKLVGPKKGLNTSTFDEFIMADTYFVNLAKEKNFDFAYYLFAFLYRPEREDLEEFKKSNDWNGDSREPFNTTKCKERVELFRKYLPKEYLIAVLYFYWGFREKNLLIYKTLFPSKSKEKNAKEKQRKNSYGWADTRLELSGHKFGNYKQTGLENWRNIIFDMHREQEKRNQREKKAAIERLKAKRR